MVSGGGTGGGYQVSVDALSQHADDVTGVMNEISDAANQAGNVVDFAAFGLIGEAWAQILRKWMNSATGYIHTAAQAGNGVAAGVRTMSANYSNTEVQVSQSFQTIANGK